MIVLIDFTGKVTEHGNDRIEEKSFFYLGVIAQSPSFNFIQFLFKTLFGVLDEILFTDFLDIPDNASIGRKAVNEEVLVLIIDGE